MAEIAVNVVLEFVKCLVDPIVRQFSYLRNEKSNFKKLQNKVEELDDARDAVQRKVDKAKDNLEEIEKSVDKWLVKAEEIIKKAKQFSQDEEKAQKRCLKGLCPNLKTRYKNSKEAVNMVKDIEEHLDRREKFDQVSHHIIPESPWLESNENYEAFQSRNSTLMEIRKALEDVDVGIIGICGIGGVGKTMLVEELAREAKKKGLFHKFAKVEVSETPDIAKIQKEIADKLGLEFGEESERAGKLYARLKNEKKILIILDNIWEDLDWESIGIPVGADHGGCKLLLTARDRNLLERMKSKLFQIGFLEEEEAWSLFKKMTGNGIDIENRKFESVPRKVAKECGGLPIAIVTVGKALRNNGNLYEWRDALRELKSPPPPNLEGRMLKEAYSKIEFSYKKLDGDELKKTFLLCSRIGYTNNVLIADLFKYGLGLELFQGTTLMEEARCRVYTLVSKLKDRCLLLDGDTSESFSMHDVVREVALSISSRDEHAFTVRNEVVNWPGEDTLKNCTAISLSNSDIDEPPQDLECPHLKFFFMKPKNSSFKIPENFFARMKEVRVVDLTGMQLLSLPSSMSHLEHIRTLCLDNCLLRDIAVIGNLKELQILSLLKSDIVKLPEEIAQLTKLRLLDLTSCYKLKVIPPKVISSLSKLEELYMGNTQIQWQVEGQNVERNNASLDELRLLSKLTTLEICLKDVILPKSFFSRELKRYKILIGDEWNWFSKGEASRTLKLKLNSDICLEELQGIKNVEDLCLDELQGVKNVLYELDGGGFPTLKFLHVQNNPNFLCVVESTGLVSCDAFRLLESLFLRNLVNLEKICHAQLTTQSFSQLRILKVRKCEKLKNIFSFSVAGCLSQLQTLEVTECKNVEEIFAIGTEDDGNYNSEVINKVKFGQLRSLTLKILPQFKSVYSSTSQNRHKELTTDTSSNEIIVEDELDTSKSLFNDKIEIPILEALELSEINFERIWFTQLPAMSCCVQNLTRLIVQDCHKLKCIFSSSMVKNFQKLQHLEIGNCAVLKEIIAKEGEEADPTFVFPQVTSLILSELPELRSFYPEIHISEWPELKILNVSDCDMVKMFTTKLFSFQETDGEGQLDIPTRQPLFLVEKVFPKLEELALNAKDIKLIWHGQFNEALFGKLKSLKVMNDESTVFPLGFLRRFHNLEELALSLSSYVEVFSYADIKKHANKLAEIKILELSELTDLEHIWKQDSNLGSVLHNLETIDVEYCDKLTNLAPSSASFQNLTILDINHCNGLKTLVTSSTAKSLVQLREMSIYGCKMMTEIVANDRDGTKDDIIFRNLKLLSLDHLKSLSSFCTGNYTLKFPTLDDLTVRKCRNMEIFFQGDLITPKLKMVWLTVDGNEGCWEGDLNTTIKLLHKKLAEEPESEDGEDSETPISEEDEDE